MGPLDVTANVSVVVTAHNEEAFIGSAVESVLGQDAPPDEIIVVDDGSTDGTAGVLEALTAAYPLVRRITSSVARGAPSARNAGAALARGDLLAFLDGDDVWFPRKLSLQVALLERHEEVGYTYGSAVELKGDKINPTPERLGSATGVYRPPELCVGYLRDTFWNFWPSGLLIRHDAFQRSGGFVEALGSHQHWEDYFYACVLALSESAYVLDEPTMYYRVHDRSCSHRAQASGMTIVDERAGLEWFVAYLGERESGASTDVNEAIESRLDGNVRRFAAALGERPELGKYGALYTPDALAAVMANLHALRDGEGR